LPTRKPKKPGTVDPHLYTRRAEEELRSIWRYIAEDNDNEPAADRILLAIGAKIELLRNHPRLGPRRSDIADSARLLIESHFLILYETHPDTDEGDCQHRRRPPRSDRAVLNRQQAKLACLRQQHT
jgi:toxin ParE1/3/4